MATGNLASHANPILVKHYLKTLLNALEEKKRAEARRRNLLLAVLALLLVGALFTMVGCSSPIQSSVAEEASPEVTNKDLADTYRAYNMKYWGGELPGAHASIPIMTALG